MTLYLFQSVSILVIIIFVSDFLKKKFEIKDSAKYLYSILIIITFCFLILKAIKFLNTFPILNFDYVNIFRIFFFILLFISLLGIILLKSNFNNLDICFIVIYIAVCLLSYDRYYLDEDEFTYWGQRIKDFYYYNELQTFKISRYHQPLLTSWQLFFTNLKFSENLTIFANNVILISAFFFLSDYSRKNILSNLSFIILSFLLFYLIINNLSFGFVSIYADPIVAILSTCILKIIIEDEYDKQKIIFLFFLAFCLYFSHRLGIIFLFILLSYILLKNYNFIFLKNKKRFIISLALIILLGRYLFLNQLAYSQTPFNIFDRIDILIEIMNNFILNLKKILLIDVYFSSFGLFINKIFEIYINKKSFLNSYSINILFWSILIFILLILDKKKETVIYFILSFIFYLFVIFIEKAYFQNLSYLVFGRYASIFLLSFLLFILTRKTNYYMLISLLIFNLSITPLKSFGFFVPNNIYYSYDKNRNYKINRDQIKLFSARNSKCKKVFAIYDKKNFPNYLDGHYSLLLNIFNYELFSGKIRFQDMDELKLMKTSDFFHFYDCIFVLNVKTQELKNYKFNSNYPKKINL